MGFNTAVVIHNDALHDIAKDPDFGKNLAEAVSMLSGRGGRVNVPSGSQCNAATVIATTHSSDCVVVAVGGNYGNVLGHLSGVEEHHTEDGKDLVLGRICSSRAADRRAMRISEGPEGN